MARRAMLPEEELVHVMEVYGVGNTPMARATNAREVLGNHRSQSQRKPIGIGCISSTDHVGRQFWVVVAEREDVRR